LLPATDHRDSHHCVTQERPAAEKDACKPLLVGGQGLNQKTRWEARRDSNLIAGRTLLLRFYSGPETSTWFDSLAAQKSSSGSQSVADSCEVTCCAAVAAGAGRIFNAGPPPHFGHTSAGGTPFYCLTRLESHCGTLTDRPIFKYGDWPRNPRRFGPPQRKGLLLGTAQKERDHLSAYGLGCSVKRQHHLCQLITVAVKVGDRHTKDARQAHSHGVVRRVNA
jgi:hypothetical protein